MTSNNQTPGSSIKGRKISPADYLKNNVDKVGSNAIKIPNISLPTGGGAIKGIDEKFTVNALNGTSAISIPLPFAAARGVSPAHTLSYNSGSGNGVFGLGWQLDLPSIKRKTDKSLPQYLDEIDSDIYLFSDAEDLVPAFKKAGDGSFETDTNGDYRVNEYDSTDTLFTIRQYRPRIEGLFARIERWTEKTTRIIRWRVIGRDNITTLLGWTGNAVIADPVSTGKIAEWLPEFVYDDKGNCCQYIYKKENDQGFDRSLLHNRNRVQNDLITYTNTYLEKIIYGNKTPYKTFGDEFPAASDYLFQTVFDYGPHNENDPVETINEWDHRPDAFSDYKAGFEIRTTRLCRRVLLFHHFEELPGGFALTKSVNFNYDLISEKNFTFLHAATSYGYIKKPDGSYTSKHLPPIEFDYQQHEWSKTVQEISGTELVNAPSGLDNPNYLFTDLFNEGMAGILTEQGGGWYYKQNRGEGKFDPAKLVSPKPSFTGLGNQLQLADLDADGTRQLVSVGAETPGYFELDDENNWQPFKSFASVPNIDHGDENTRMLDLNGDGKADILISDDHVFTLYLSAGRNGYEPAQKTWLSFDEEEGPRVLFSDPAQTVFLADMSGDGMTDIVRIRNGEVCYWPNMGYGKFGSKISMDNAPFFDHPDTFDPSFLRLSDIDGSGTTDIIYLGKNRFSCWLNFSGNSFGVEPFEIASFPAVDNRAVITVADLLGNGLACIVWSAPVAGNDLVPVKYIDLTQSRKPHIMTGYKNNLGKEVRFEYTPSTKFYIEDKQAGRPWITKLHFPVHCLSKIEIIDRITGSRFVSSFKYHHGYFDHAEREFRGFGMVEQTDSEHFEHWIKGNSSNIVESTLHQEPVVSKTWVHTGAFLGRENILEQYAHEYWYEEMKRQGFTVNFFEHNLPDAHVVAAPGLPADTINSLSATEWREALRACKGLPLRSEVFAHDAPLSGATEEQIKKQLTPYTVGTHNCMIELLQPKGKNRFAVFVVKESESISYNYERNTDDPRITHNLNIKIDELGNVLESASVQYPRMTDDPALPVMVRGEQTKTLITYAVNEFTNDITGDHINRLRLPAVSKVFELKGLAKAGTYYSMADFEQMPAAVTEVPYHHLDDPAPGTIQKRLLEHSRTTYRSNNLFDELPVGQLESLAFSFENYLLAFTPDLITDIFATKVDDSILAEGKFVQIDNNWWIRSGTTELLQPAETVADAANRFYVPLAYTDPFGSTTKIKYHSNRFLWIEQTENDQENKVTIELFNFYTLSPQRVRNENNNLTEAIPDELGLIKAMAMAGKGNDADDLTGLTAHTDQAEIDLVNNYWLVPDTPDGTTDSVALHNIARSLLQHATIRFVYDFDAYARSGSPAVVSTIMREEHHAVDQQARQWLSFEYSNGLGEVAMKKVQAEPGEALKAVINADDTVSVSTIDTSLQNPVQLRWIGNGRTVLNNKGNVVKQFEPYFSVSHRYESVKELVETGSTPLFYYDAPGRLVKTEMPDDTFSKTTIDPWQQVIYDPNDTIDNNNKWYTDRINNLIDAELLAEGKDPEKEKATALKAFLHGNTPSTIHFDTMGRVCCFTAHNKAIDVELYATLAALDIEGNLLKLTDAAGNDVVQYKYDMTGNLLYQNSMDTGERWILNNCMDMPFYSWDAKGQMFRTAYDVLHRPLISTFTKNNITIITDRHEYTDEKGLSATDLQDRRQRNLIGKPTVQYDNAGITRTLRCDIKGNALETSRQLCSNYQDIPHWPLPHTNDMEDEIFFAAAEFDALNRTKRLLTPHTNDIPASVFLPHYNETGMLNGVRVNLRGSNTPTDFVNNIKYNPKGQREAIFYANNTVTRYTYDKNNFQLLRLLTTGNNGAALLQDIHYTYDPVGNIQFTSDNAQPTIIFNGQEVKPENEYDYDATYQLMRVTGREHIGQNSIRETGGHNNIPNFPYEKNIHPHDIQAFRNYTRQYVYDAVGNILSMQHMANGGSWTRNYWYNNNDVHRSQLGIATGTIKNNQLLQTQIGNATPFRYQHDVHGNMINQPHLAELIWNYKDQLQQIDLGGGGKAFYVYDSNGIRIRKVIEKSGGQKEERLYFGDFEIYREKSSNGSITKQTETLHITDDTGRIAMVDTQVIPGDDEEQLIRFIYSDRNGSAQLELNGQAERISYEEYHPFGTTSYSDTSATVRAVAKRYRYVGMERDEESGMSYHNARYYLNWLGRWLNADPIGIAGGSNLYRYANNDPVAEKDTNGMETNEQAATRIFSTFLTNQNVTFHREVYYEVKVDGKWVRGRVDFMVKTAPNTWVPVEMKGKANSSWTEPQKKYLKPLLGGAEWRTDSSHFPKQYSSKGGHMYHVDNIAKGKYNFRRIFTNTVIIRPGGNPALGRAVTVKTDINGKVESTQSKPTRWQGMRSGMRSFGGKMPGLAIKGLGVFSIYSAFTGVAEAGNAVKEMRENFEAYEAEQQALRDALSGNYQWQGDEEPEEPTERQLKLPDDMKRMQMQFEAARQNYAIRQAKEAAEARKQQAEPGSGCYPEEIPNPEYWYNMMAPVPIPDPQAYQPYITQWVCE